MIDTFITREIVEGGCGFGVEDDVQRACREIGKVHWGELDASLVEIGQSFVVDGFRISGGAIEIGFDVTDAEATVAVVRLPIERRVEQTV